jgi:hypothetical protein
MAEIQSQPAAAVVTVGSVGGEEEEDASAGNERAEAKRALLPPAEVVHFK